MGEFEKQTTYVLVIDVIRDVLVEGKKVFLCVGESQLLTLVCVLTFGYLASFFNMFYARLLIMRSTNLINVLPLSSNLLFLCNYGTCNQTLKPFTSIVCTPFPKRFVGSG